MNINQKVYLTLGKIGVVFTTIVTADIGDIRAVSICAAELCDGF